MIAANERKASRFPLASFLATVAILRTFQYGRDIIGKVYYGRALDFDGTCKSLASVEIQQKMGYFLMVRKILDLLGFHTFPLQLYVTFDFHCGKLLPDFDKTCQSLVWKFDNNQDII